MKKIIEKYSNLYFKFGLTIFIMVTIYGLNFLFNPESLYWNLWKNYTLLEIISDIGCTLIFSWIIIETSVFIAWILEKFYPWTKSPIIRFVIQTLLIVCTVLVAISLQDAIFLHIFNDNKMPVTTQEALEERQFFLIIIIVSLFVSAVHTSSYLLRNWKNSISEATELRVKTLELKNVAMQAELQSLKIQLDPHFMFNNFSTLSELINEDATLANDFLENLSHVYRYMIINQKKDLISLKEEIAFIKQYYYLIYIRHGENVQLNITLNDDVLNLNVPPISVQLLVENAIKHNIATLNNPLIINISSEDSFLKVCNNLQRISNSFPSTGIGLKNITDRYSLLSSDKLPVIQETENCFCVSLPLINFNA